MGEKEDVKQVLDRMRVSPGKKVNLDDYPTSWKEPETLSLGGLPLSKTNADELLARSNRELARMQEVLWADDRFALLIILQGMDAAGKDGIVKHVMAGVNPQVCQVTSFKTPTTEEASHDFLWRCVKALPEKGRIGIFNRSFYEEVLVVRVHPSFLEGQKLPSKEVDESFWKARYESINDLERHLHRSGTKIIKLFLNVSPEEQRKRLLERMDEREKWYKFNPSDVTERDRWPQYMDAYTRMLQATSTEHAPWFVLPADQKWLSRALAAHIIATELRGLGLRFPELSEEYKRAVDEARSKLVKQ